MKPFKSHSIIEALAIGTVPVVGAFLIWALWPVHGTIVELHGTVAEVHQGAHTLTPKIGTILDSVPGVLAHTQTATDAATSVLQAAVPVVASFKDTAGKLNNTIDLTSHRLFDLCPFPGAVDAAIHPCGTLADFIAALAAPVAQVWIVDPNRGNRSAFHKNMARHGFRMREDYLGHEPRDGVPAYKGRMLTYLRT